MNYKELEKEAFAYIIKINSNCLVRLVTDLWRAQTSFSSYISKAKK